MPEPPRLLLERYLGRSTPLQARRRRRRCVRVSDEDLGHASSVAEQLRLAEKNGNLADELADECDGEESDEEENDGE